MAQIDYGLLANMGGAYAKGQMAAQNYSLNNARMGALQRQQQEEDALRNVLATRSEGELYGLTAHNLARQGGGARDILALEQMGQKQKQLEASSQRQLMQDQQTEAKNMLGLYQKQIEIAAKNGDQAAVDSIVQHARTSAAQSNNPYFQKAVDAFQSVQLKGDGLEMVMNAPGAILVQQGFKDLDPNANYKITRKNGKYTKIEQDKEEKDPTSVREYRFVNAQRKANGKEPYTYEEFLSKYKTNPLNAIVSNAISGGGNAPTTRPNIDPQKPDAPQAQPPIGAGKQLTPEMAQQYLQKAGGDKEKARKAAAKDGWTF